MPSLGVVMVMSPPAMRTESFASKPSEAQSMTMVPPVILRSSLQLTPLSVELMLSVPRPFSTRSSREKITASVLVSPSAEKVPVTESVLVLPSVVVTKTLSADFT